MIRILRRTEVESLLNMPLAIRAMEEAFRQYKTGKSIMPLRTHLSVPEKKSTSLFMPVYLEDNLEIGIKSLTLTEDNPQKGLPVIQALVTLFDVDTGMPKALIDGASLTAIRTGAVSGLATQLFANRDARVVAIFGGGIQGRTQLEAVAAVRNINKVFLYEPNQKQAKGYINDMQAKINCDIIHTDCKEFLKEVDVICTATNSESPLFCLQHLKDGCHINAVGSYKPTMHEISEDIVVASCLVVDDKEACLEETGDLITPIKNGIISEEDITLELGDVIVNELKVRKNLEDITFFKSVGLAIQDLAAASALFKEAEKQNLGVCVEM